MTVNNRSVDNELQYQAATSVNTEIEITLPMIRELVRKQAPYYSDELVNNIAQAVYDQEEKILAFAGFWDRIKPNGLIRTVRSAVNAIGTVLNSGVEFVKNISFKNAFNPSEWRADPVRAAGKELKKGLNQLGEVLDVPDYLDEAIGYVGIGLAGAAGFIVGGPAGAYAAGKIVAVTSAASATVAVLDEAGEALKEISTDVDQITTATVDAVQSFGNELKDKDLNIGQIIDNANNFENKINSAVDKMTIFSDTAKTDLKNFISSEAEISKMTGALPMDIKDLLDGINTAPAELQEKLSAGIKAINARAESAIRMAQGVETLQANFIKLGKEAKQKAEENLKLVESIKTDAATNKFNLDEIKLTDYKTENKIRIYRQLLSDKNQIIKRLTADVGEVKTYIADKTTMATDEIEDLTAKIQELEDSLDYVYSIVSDELEDLL